MSRWLMAAALVLVLTAETRGSESVFIGDKLYEYCSKEETLANMPFAGSCAGYIIAIAELVQRTDLWGARACLPNNVTAKELVYIVKVVLEANPDTRHYDGSLFVARTLAQAFPCE